jgi:hypothetical protein
VGGLFGVTTLGAFRGALKVGKAQADERVARSLYQRAVGYSFHSEKVHYDKDRAKWARTPIVEHVPPDVTACIFWLKNRDPARWRDAWQVEHTLGKYVISDKPMTEEQWALERADVIDITPTEEDEKK